MDDDAFCFQVVSGAGSKRSSISFDDNAGKKPRGGGSGSSWRGGKSGLYQPPTGKYSTGVGEYSKSLWYQFLAEYPCLN